MTDSDRCFNCNIRIEKQSDNRWLHVDAEGNQYRGCRYEARHERALSA